MFVAGPKLALRLDPAQADTVIAKALPHRGGRTPGAVHLNVAQPTPWPVPGAGAQVSLPRWAPAAASSVNVYSADHHTADPFFGTLTAARLPGYPGRPRCDALARAGPGWSGWPN